MKIESNQKPFSTRTIQNIKNRITNITRFSTFSEAKQHLESENEKRNEQSKWNWLEHKPQQRDTRGRRRGRRVRQRRHARRTCRPWGTERYDRRETGGRPWTIGRRIWRPWACLCLLWRSENSYRIFEIRIGICNPSGEKSRGKATVRLAWGLKVCGALRVLGKAVGLYKSESYVLIGWWGEPRIASVEIWFLAELEKEGKFLGRGQPGRCVDGSKFHNCSFKTVSFGLPWETHCTCARPM